MLQVAAAPETRESPLRTAPGRVEVYRSCADIEPEVWEACYGEQAKDGRFYRIVEECLGDQFAFRYLVMRNGSEAAVQPGMVVDQDGVAGVRRVVGGVRKVFPRLLRLRLLMVGCAAGEGIPGSLKPWALEALHDALPAVARSVGAPIIVLKDVPSEYREAISAVFERDYRRVPGLPAAVLDLAGYSSFEDYLQSRVGKVFRKNLRRKFRKLNEAPEITMEVMTDVSPIVDELFALYWQMYERAELEFEVLNREYFERLGREIPDKTRFFIWRQEGRIITFNLCLVHDRVIYDLDLGMDYSVALGLHMYFVTWRDVVQWSIEQGLRMYHAGPLNYDPKLHLKLALAPQDLYARHVSAWVNPVFKFAMGFMHPVRHNPLIGKFENAAEV